MRRRILSIGFALVVVVTTATAADTAAGRSKLSAVEIVDKNIAARGGLQAWRLFKLCRLQVSSALAAIDVER